jgi:hypothetical protein
MLNSIPEEYALSLQNVSVLENTHVPCISRSVLVFILLERKETKLNNLKILFFPFQKK